MSEFGVVDRGEEWKIVKDLSRKKKNWCKVECKEDPEIDLTPKIKCRPNKLLLRTILCLNYGPGRGKSSEVTNEHRPYVSIVWLLKGRVDEERSREVVESSNGSGWIGHMDPSRPSENLFPLEIVTPNWHLPFGGSRGSKPRQYVLRLRQYVFRGFRIRRRSTGRW